MIVTLTYPLLDLEDMQLLRTLIPMVVRESGQSQGMYDTFCWEIIYIFSQIHIVVVQKNWKNL